MGTIVVYRALPKAVVEIKQPLRVAHVFLLSDVIKEVSEYPDTGVSAAPQDNN